MTTSKLLVTVAIAGAVFVTGRSARAQIPVTDAGNLAQNIVTALKTTQTVLNTYQQIQQLATQIQNQMQMLKSIDPTTFTGLQQLLLQGQFTYAMIQGDLDSISFNVGSVNRDFDRLFPNRKQAQWSGARYSDFNAYYDGWNGEIATSSQAAVRAQASIGTLDATNRQIISILNQSSSASTGQVRQLQLVNQQLAVLHKDLGSILQNLAATGRVLTEWTAGSVGERMMSRERGRRRLDGYTSRGRPSRVLNRLP
jgi:P-type conjugative transfer protein TrbJ